MWQLGSVLLIFVEGSKGEGDKGRRVWSKYKRQE